ncbi:hypothetical protein Hoch_4135 [Haliangium ochraceum DSM 14365]|uniref:Uncharacterized protein n=1 Tax=Haliangium ochraceum (strain DSM 14365 / JCM 11303 / SMP-2) TaxID=502025 RepID=D0LKR3_HALO1|nr:hypothetical protein Hoch_4135 [Haliangium ochraceum DSM 14365]
MALVDVASLADTVRELHSCSLLNHVRSLVSRCVEIGRLLEANPRTGGVGLRAHRAACLRGRAADMRLDVAYIVLLAKGVLDAFEVGERGGGA